MSVFFEVKDKTNRTIRLTRERWSHITTTHAEMTNYVLEIEYALCTPLKITPHRKGNLSNYYAFIKQRKYPEKYLKVVVKYLNGHGFVITAHFVRHIQ